MTEQEKMDSLSRMFSTLIRTPLSEVESVIRKGNIEQRPVAPVEELTDTYTKIAAENEPITFSENIAKPQVKQEFLADAPSFMKLLPKEERIDENKFEQKVVVGKDNVRRLVTVPREEEPQDFMVNEERVSYQPPREEFVPDFGGVTEAMEREKQRLEKEDIKETEKTIQDIETEKQKLKEEQPKAETTGTTYTSSSLYNNLNSKDEKIFDNAARYLYNQGTIRTEWDGKQPLFDFVEYDDDLDSSAFGPGQIIYSTAEPLLKGGKIEGKEAQNFAKKMIAAQKLFYNMYDKRRKKGAYLPKEASNTKKAAGYLKDLGITREQFLNYVKQGYFLPSNHPLSKKRREDGLMTGIPLELLGDNYEENYFKIYKAVLKEKLSRKDTKDLDSLLQNYHGGSDKADKAYSKKTQGFLNLMEE